ncbi:MAG: TonB-dependent receptor plug domain-containing protein [Verrucomicrobiota bacterium JB022]|nr:TonB-dependent receptor plug domain-containing protein [Verrucomicrobiota bacterium JB022]
MIVSPRMFSRAYWLLGMLLPAAAVFAQTPAATQTADSEEVFELSPFEITSSGDIGYAATETLAGTRLRTELRDVANSITVVNEKFIQDTGVTDTQSLLVYTTGTEVGGLQGNYLGAGDASRLREQSAVAPQNNTRVRGLDSADNVRNFFLSDIPWDGYNVGRVDLQRGANSMLFGIGSPAGIINTNLREAQYNTMGEVEYRFSEHDSHRVSGDYNVEVLDDELAVRVIGLYEDEKFQQKPAFERDKRVFGSARWDPKLLKFENASTTIKFNYENGEIRSNRPRSTPPIDRITPWFTELNQQTYGAINMHGTSYDEWLELGQPADYGAVNRTLQREGSTAVTNPNYQPWVAGRGGDYFGGPMVIFPNNSSRDQAFIMPGQWEATAAVPDGFGGVPFQAWYGIQTYEEYARLAQLPGHQIGAFKEKLLTDDNIFDFYNNLLDGPNKREWTDFEAYNFTILQSFFDHRVGIEYARDYQEVDRGQMQTISGSGYALTVDVMATLPNGQPNPNVGRAMVASRGGSNDSRHSERTTDRVTAYGELDFSDFMEADSLLTRILGRHLFTGVYTTMDYDVDSYAWERFAAEEDYFPADKLAVSEGERQVSTLSYLTDPLFGVSLGNLSVPRIGAIRNPTGGTIPLFSLDVVNPGLPMDDLDRYQGWTDTQLAILNAERGDRTALYTPGGTSMSHNEIDSYSLVWQGFLMDGLIVPTVGWREDKALYATSGGGLPGETGWYIPDSAADAYPTIPDTNRRYAEVEDESLTWGVVLHMPDSIREKLPYGLDLSVHYGESSNFRPQPERVDPLGNPLQSPTGETTEYGFTVSALENRVIFKVNWYETDVTNATLSNAVTNDYLLGYGEAWAYQFAVQAKTAYELGRPYGSFTSNFNEGGNFFLPYEPQEGQTVEEARDAMLETVNAIIDNPPPQSLQQAWGYNLNQWAAGDTSGGINITYLQDVTVTGDTHSEGIEFELTTQITPNWNVTINAAKTEATRFNIAESIAAWVDQRYAFYQGPGGDARFWWGGAGTETLRGKFESEFYGNYQLQQLLEGSNVAELRPWRVNVVTNYSFSEGPLKGVNVGGAYRWQDEILLGYGIAEDPDSSVGYRYDLSKKYYGDAESDFDFWVGYQRDLPRNLRWRIQLNVRNAFADNELIPVTVQPDGSPGGFRIKEGTSWFLTNTISF